MKKVFSIVFLISLVLFIQGCKVEQLGKNALDSNYTQSNVQVTIQDNSKNHVHASGQAFTIDITAKYSNTAKLYYFWTDFRGRQYSQPVVLLSGQKKTIKSPDDQVGYYGLTLQPENDSLVLPERQAGEAREYGFVILTPKTTLERITNAKSPFGIVQADFNDPYIPTWVKTTTWKTFSPDEWAGEMQQRRDLGVIELPLILDDEWYSDDKKPISAQQLSSLEIKIKRYFSADLAIKFWELGLEENLEARFNDSYYWKNLEAKTKIIRQVANAVNPEIKLIYQIAELDLKPIQAFLQSTAAQYFDVLSLHPYAWPDFKSPELWLPDYLDGVRQLLEQENRPNMLIWFTEVGAPENRNYPGGFFGYPESGDSVKGLNAKEVSGYLIKIHVLALNLGVEKVFWYNYQDNGKSRNYAEDNFGMRDFWGFPKPVYASYINMYANLYQKLPLAIRTIPNNILVYPFESANEVVLVIWSKTDTEQLIALSSLQDGLVLADIIDIVNTVGTPMVIENDVIPISTNPVFVRIKK
ncbi:MAG: hypothetical protein ACC657_04960 [Thiohalomonadales bacterium]